MHFRSMKAAWMSRLGMSHVCDVPYRVRAGGEKRMGEYEPAYPVLDNPNAELRDGRKIEN